MDIVVAKNCWDASSTLLGRPLDGKGPVASSKRLLLNAPPPPIMDRSPVTVPLQTGLKVH